MAKKLSTEEVYNRCKYSNLILISSYINKRTKIIVKCYCGNIFDTNIDSISSGLTVSCGCYRNFRLRQSNSKNLLNKRFNRLLVIELVNNIIGDKTGLQWLCRCDCGNYKIVGTNNLQSKNTKSCGCLDIELSTNRLLKLHVSQKGINHPSYKSWLSIEDRKNRRLTIDGKKWISSVLYRDNYICQICKLYNCNLNVHHLDGWNWCIEKRFDINNGVTLCSACHIKFHKLYGYGNNTQQQYIEYKENI